MSDSFVHIAAFQGPISLSCSYDKEELRADLTARVRMLLHAYIPCDDPRLPEFLSKYSEHAYKIFTGRIHLEVHRLPELVLRKVIYKTFGALEVDGLVPYDARLEVRKMWDDIAADVLRSLRDDWLTLKPGAKQLTTKEERARMLTFYYEVLPIFQEAKNLYKQISIHQKKVSHQKMVGSRQRTNSSNWKSKVKKQFPNLDDVVVDSLPDHKPSELAELQTGLHFHKVIGNDFKGLAEVRRQLYLARRDAKTRDE